MGYRASRKKRIRDGLLTWYSYLSHHDLGQFIILSFTLPLHHIITAYLRFGGQSHSCKYLLPLFSKVWQYLAIITITTKHISQSRLSTISQTWAVICFLFLSFFLKKYLLLFLSSNSMCLIPSLPKCHPISTEMPSSNENFPNCSSVERCLYSEFSEYLVMPPYASYQMSLPILFYF